MICNLREPGGGDDASLEGARFSLDASGFQRFGMIPGKDSRATFEALIDHPLRNYRAFAEEASANW